MTQINNMWKVNVNILSLIHCIIHLLIPHLPALLPAFSSIPSLLPLKGYWTFAASTVASHACNSFDLTLGRSIMYSFLQYLLHIRLFCLKTVVILWE